MEKMERNIRAYNNHDKMKRKIERYVDYPDE